MTTTWRVCRAAFADLTGEGARLYGGRWNSPGSPVVYTATDAALAALEVRVHLDLPVHLMPDDYLLTRISVGDVPMERIGAVPEDPREFGDQWLRSARSPTLEVPSAILPESTNLLINPSHPLSRGVRIESVRPFVFDPRLWAAG